MSSFKVMATVALVLAVLGGVERVVPPATTDTAVCLLERLGPLGDESCAAPETADGGLLHQAKANPDPPLEDSDGPTQAERSRACYSGAAARRLGIRPDSPVLAMTRLRLSGQDPTRRLLNAFNRGYALHPLASEDVLRRACES
jgi:hypothetical protein